jgi:Zn-dependent protease with chaperone function
MGRLLATFVTLGLLGGFLLAVVLGLMVAFGAVNIVVAVAVVVLFNLLLLLIGPKLNDALYRWLYDLEWVDFEEFRRRSPESAAVVEEVTTDYGYDRPKLGLIPDRNPTAFTYGSGRFNGRIVVTEGCFEYLDDNELSSVLAHELGHITSRDFIIMTLANTIVEVLYLVAVHSARIASAGGASGTGGGSSGSKDKATSALFAVAYVLWFVGEYAVLYLSRTREYAADRFAAEYTHPDYLSSALVKIAYGIILSDDSPELEQATRNIGIMNAEQSKDEGVVYYNCERMDDFEPLMKSFLFDLENPWAKVSEITSTHP